MEKETCSGCENHCAVDDLKCGKGAKLLGLRREEKNLDELPAEERVLVLLRKCGHYLHHNAGRDADPVALFGGLSEEEKSALELLLKKCLEYWKTPEERRAGE